MKKIKYFLLVFLIQFILISINSKTIDLVIFFTNDTNGHPLNFTYMEDSNQGGIPARAALLKKLINEKNKDTEYLILDAGGIVSGRPESNLYNGETDLIGMKSIGYFASGVGYAELSMSLKYFKKLNNKADFYYICSNVTDKKNRNICDKYIITKIGRSNPLKIGLFSLISLDYIDVMPESLKSQYKFLDPIKTAEKMVSELKSKKNKCDIIIALTQLGYYKDDAKFGSKTLALKVNDIDIIIDGRTGVKLDNPVIINKTKICQTIKWGLFLGEIDLKIEDNKIIDFKYKHHSINYKKNGKLLEPKIIEDEKTLKIIKNKTKKIDKLLSVKIATIKNGKYDPKNASIKETEIGNLICDSMLDYSKADIAFQNAGGIGNNIVDNPNVTRKSFDELIKYDNSIIVLNLTGEEILKILEFSMLNSGNGSFLQVGGIRFTYSKQRKKFIDIKINGKDMILSNTYKAAINSWLSDGGDDYKIFAEKDNKVDLNIFHRENLYNYLAKLKVIQPYLDGRINIID